jgi:Spy/CpxP family protein refolding chaperone
MKTPLFSRRTLIAFVAGAACATGIGALARAQNLAGLHHMMMGGGQMAMGSGQSPADLTAHIEKGLKHLYVEIDATDAQKAQIDALVKQALGDMQTLQSQLQSMHMLAMQAITQTPVDRASLEAARASNLEVEDQASRRFVQLVADVGDLLTPEQRKALAEHLAKAHSS